VLQWTPRGLEKEETNEHLVKDVWRKKSWRQTSSRLQPEDGGGSPRQSVLKKSSGLYAIIKDIIVCVVSEHVTH